MREVYRLTSAPATWELGRVSVYGYADFKPILGSKKRGLIRRRFEKSENKYK